MAKRLTYHRGSPNGTPSKSDNTSPLMIFLCLQGVTRAAMELTFASGPRVAARRGIPVLANHQSASSSSSHFFHMFHHLFLLFSSFIGVLVMFVSVCCCERVGRFDFSSSCCIFGEPCLHSSPGATSDAGEFTVMSADRMHYNKESWRRS